MVINKTVVLQTFVVVPLVFIHYHMIDVGIVIDLEMYLTVKSQFFKQLVYKATLYFTLRIQIMSVMYPVMFLNFTL